MSDEQKNTNVIGPFGSSPVTRHSSLSSCPHCDGTGWMPTAPGARGVTRCVCKRPAKPAQTMTPLAEVMAVSPAVKAALSETDKRVAEVIRKCRGAEQAVTSAEIAGHLWPGTSMDAKHAERLRRDVTDSVNRLRLLGRIPIAASKQKPFGYFIPVTAEELRDMHDRLFREGVKLIVLSQLYGEDANLVRELEGQLELKESGARSQESVGPNGVRPLEAR